MSGVADNGIVRRGRRRFNGWRSAAVLRAVLAHLAKEACAKPPRWQSGKSKASAIRPRAMRNAHGDRAGSSRARESSVTYAPIGQKRKQKQKIDAGA